MGTLPVKAGVEYTAEEIKNMHTVESYKEALENEIRTNKDENCHQNYSTYRT